MLGMLLFILLLPVTLYFIAKILFEDTSKPVVFLENWVYSNLYHLGVMLGAVGRLFIPAATRGCPNDEDAETPTVENELIRGIKDTWK